MDIIMIRHGESEDNINKIYGRDDTKLTLTGIKQIKTIKSELKKLNFTRVYYSPLVRTKETIKKLSLEGIGEKRIQELNFGIFKGKNYETILREFPKETKKWTDNPISYKIPKGESVVDVYKRLENFLEELVRNNENVLLVTHEGIIRLINCWVFNNPEYFFRFKADNASINIVSIVDGYKYISKSNYNKSLL